MNIRRHLISPLLTLLTLGAGGAQASAQTSAERAAADSLSFDRLCRSIATLTPEGREKAVAEWMTEMATDSARYRSLYNLASGRLFSRESPSRDDELFIPFLKEAIWSGRLGEAETERARFCLDMALRNRVGSKAEDFAMRLRDGSTTRLDSIRTDRDILLIFYNPDCDTCHELMERIEKEGIDRRYTIVAVDAEEDLQLWERTAPQLPASWTVGFATDPIQEDETYFIPEIPTVYILTPEKTVVRKEADPTTI